MNTAWNSGAARRRADLGNGCGDGSAMARGSPRAAGALDAEAGAALGATAGEDSLAAGCEHALAEAMAALADELGGLIGALHVLKLRSGPWEANVFNNMPA